MDTLTTLPLAPSFTPSSSSSFSLKQRWMPERQQILLPGSYKFGSNTTASPSRPWALRRYGMQPLLLLMLLPSVCVGDFKRTHLISSSRWAYVTSNSLIFLINSFAGGVSIKEIKQKHVSLSIYTQNCNSWTLFNPKKLGEEPPISSSLDQSIIFLCLFITFEALFVRSVFILSTPSLSLSLSLFETLSPPSPWTECVRSFY